MTSGRHTNRTGRSHGHNAIVLSKSIQDPRHHDNTGENKKEDHGNAAIIRPRKFCLPFCTSLRDAEDAHKEERLRRQPVDQSTSYQERDGVGIGELKIMCFSLLAMRVRDAEG